VTVSKSYGEPIDFALLREFIDTWARIKWPRAAVETAQWMAAKLPLSPYRCYSAGYAAFVSLAGHLQRNVSGSILLPCRKIATILCCERDDFAEAK
jgi:hypothetical protein